MGFFPLKGVKIQSLKEFKITKRGKPIVISKSNEEAVSLFWELKRVSERLVGLLGKSKPLTYNVESEIKHASKSRLKRLADFIQQNVDNLPNYGYFRVELVEEIEKDKMRRPIYQHKLWAIYRDHYPGEPLAKEKPNRRSIQKYLEKI